MKKSIKFLAAAMIAVSVASCRNNDAPEDIHDHDEVNKVVLTVTENGTSNVQTITYTGNGVDKALTLAKDKVYNADIKFYGVHGNTTEDMTPEIIKEKNEHFIKYSFAGVSVKIDRTADDVTRTDGNKVGLKTQWTVTSSAANAKGQIVLQHQPATINQAANNGGGTTTGGEADVDMTFDIK